MVHFSGVTGTEAAAPKEINGIAAKANALTTVNKYAFLFVMDLIPLDLGTRGTAYDGGSATDVSGCL
jgi:hypothetical protein